MPIGWRIGGSRSCIGCRVVAAQLVGALDDVGDGCDLLARHAGGEGLGAGLAGRLGRATLCGLGVHRLGRHARQRTSGRVDAHLLRRRARVQLQTAGVELGCRHVQARLALGRGASGGVPLRRDGRRLVVDGCGARALDLCRVFQGQSAIVKLAGEVDAVARCLCARGGLGLQRLDHGRGLLLRGARIGGTG